MGDGVNIAARLESICEPGGVCLSGAAYEQARDKLREGFVDLGEKPLKNIARPVRAFGLDVGSPRWQIARAPNAAKADERARRFLQGRALWSRMLPGRSLSSIVAAAGAYAWRAGLAPRLLRAPRVEDKLSTAPRSSIDNLPFENLSGDKEQDYFADGITDDLTTDLSHLPGSFVIARGTAFTFKGKAVDAKEIGRELGVRYVLEGSVHRVGENITVNAQLISTETGAHIWADRFDGECRSQSRRIAS